VPELDDGDSVEVQGSSSTYTLKRIGDVYSCSCPAWLHQSMGIDQRTCKHLRAYLGEEHESARVGVAVSTARAQGGIAGSTKTGEGAPPVLLAHKWEVEHDPTGWWMSEKLDGIRAYWDGEGFVSRLGNRFAAPPWFVEDLPANTLDGELWVGRKLFNRTTSIVRSGAAGKDWKTVRYVVFDAPAHGGTFEERTAFCRELLDRGLPYASWHPHEKCDGIDHLRTELERVEGLGGEGLMLRQPGSRYVSGRSNTLLKVKTFHDAEARVLDHVPGTGKHKGRLGALVVELPNGTRFNVGTGFSDRERQAPPDVGAVITFRYQELTEDGVPRFPSYVGVRLDAAWPSEKSRPAADTLRGRAAAKEAKGTRLVLDADGRKVETTLVLDGNVVRMSAVETYATAKKAERARDALRDDLVELGYETES
jgi:DNA ligase-1